MTATNTDELTGLDFEPQLPCEMGRVHKASGSDQPAMFLIATMCPACHNPDYDRTCCLPCWEYAGPPRTLRDSACGQGGFTRDECWTIVRVIGGA